MATGKDDPRTRAALVDENERLRQRIGEAEQALGAIRTGNVDALVIAGPGGEQVYSLTGAERAYRTIVETMNEAALTVGLDGTILFCNQRFCELVRTPMHKVLGSRVTRFAAPAQRQTLERVMADVQTAPLQQHVTLHSADEAAVPVLLAANLLDGPDGVSICLVASDLTQLEEASHSIRALREQRQALETSEQALRESERRFRMMADGLPLVVWVTDAQGGIQFVNRTYRDFFGVTEEQVREAGWQPLVHSDDAPTYVGEFLTALEQHRPFHAEARVRRADGEWRWITSVGDPYFSASGQFLGLVGGSLDVTERKVAEKALQQWSATLEEKVAERTAELEHRTRQLQELALELSQAEDRERKRLAEILHDDLQQQLAGTKFHVGLLAKRVREDPHTYDLVKQIEAMIKTAIDKSRNLSHELSPAILHHGTLAETLEWLGQQMKAKHGLAVSVNSRGWCGSDADALKTFLYQATRELLFNVVKHAGTQEVTVRVRRLGRYLCVSVSDPGNGFDPQSLKAAKGFGLLSIRERVQLLGGRMKISSANGRGSRFVIVVEDSPVAERKARKTVVAAPAARRAPAKRKRLPIRVLLADDHAVVREGLVSMLADQPDVKVVGEAIDGRDAIDQAQRLQPDVVVMDVSMPQLNGDLVAERIKQEMPATRIVALSMLQEEATKERMRQAGAECYLLKTVTGEDILAAIRGAEPAEQQGASAEAR